MEHALSYALLAFSTFSTPELAVTTQNLKDQNKAVFQPTLTTSYNTKSSCSICENPTALCPILTSPKSIDRYCYIPAYYKFDPQWGIFLSGDFLYWYSGESGAAYVVGYNQKLEDGIADNKKTPFEVDTPFLYGYTATGWAPGFRVGLGWTVKCDGWDPSIVWTHYQNNTLATQFFNLDGGLGQRYSSIPSQFGRGCYVQNSYVTSFLNIDSPQDPVLSVPFSFVSARWKVNLNIIDFELGRKNMLSKAFSLRPFAGVRAASIKTQIISQGIIRNYPAGTPTILVSFHATDHFRNKYQGAGLFMGCEPNFFLTPCFSLFAKADIALIWGKYQAKKSQNYLISGMFINEVTKSLFRYASTVSNGHLSLNPHHPEMHTAVDLALGFDWSRFWHADRIHTSLTLGWENHLWINQTQRLISIGSTKSTTNFDIPDLPSYTSISGPENQYLEKCDLSMGGLTVHFRLDF